MYGNGDATKEERNFFSRVVLALRGAMLKQQWYHQRGVTDDIAGDGMGPVRTSKANNMHRQPARIQEYGIAKVGAVDSPYSSCKDARKVILTSTVLQEDLEHQEKSPFLGRVQPFRAPH